MFSIALTIHLILCVLLTALVLKQQGKGADMGATLGGGSNTLFGAGGANDLIVKLTTTLAICFFISSIVLIHLYRDEGVTIRQNNPLTSSSVMNGATVVAPDATTTSSAASSDGVGTTEPSKDAPVAAAPAAATGVDTSTEKAAPAPQEPVAKQE